MITIKHGSMAESSDSENHIQRHLIIDAKEILENEDHLKSLNERIFRVVELLIKGKRSGDFSELKEELNIYLDRLRNSMEIINRDVSRQLLESDDIMREFYEVLELLLENDGAVFAAIDKDQAEKLFEAFSKRKFHRVMLILKQMAISMGRVINDNEPVHIFMQDHRTIIRDGSGIRIVDANIEDLIRDIKGMLKHHLSSGDSFDYRLNFGKTFIESLIKLIEIVVEHYESLDNSFDLTVDILVHELVSAKETENLLKMERIKQVFPDSENYADQIDFLIHTEHDFESIEFRNLVREQRVEELIEEKLGELAMVQSGQS